MRTPGRPRMITDSSRLVERFFFLNVEKIDIWKKKKTFWRWKRVFANSTARFLNLLTQCRYNKILGSECTEGFAVSTQELMVVYPVACYTPYY